MEHSIQKKWSSTNILSEFRFQPSPNFFDAKEKIFKSLLCDFPSYNLDKMDVLSMHSKNFPGINIQLMPGRFTFTFENGGDVEEFTRECNKTWNIINKHLNIKSIDRLGVRSYFLKSMNDDEAKNVILKLLNKNLLNNDIINAQLVLNFQDRDSNARVSISKGTLQSINVAQVQSQLDLISGIVVDIDFFAENAFSHHVNTLVSKSANEFSKYLSMLD